MYFPNQVDADLEDLSKPKASVSDKWNFKLNTLALIIANIFVLVYALQQNVSLTSILVVYLAQTIFIIFFSILNILLLRDFSVSSYTYNMGSRDGLQNFWASIQPGNIYSKISLVLYLLVFASGIVCIYGAFLFVIFGFAKVDGAYVIYSSGVFFINHLFSFLFIKFIEKDKNKFIDIHFNNAIVRMLPLHVFIFIAFVLFFLYPPIISLISAGIWLGVFVLLKTIVDVITDLNQHRIVSESMPTRAVVTNEFAKKGFMRALGFTIAWFCAIGIIILIFFTFNR